MLRSRMEPTTSLSHAHGVVRCGKRGCRHLCFLESRLFEIQPYGREVQGSLCVALVEG